MGVTTVDLGIVTVPADGAKDVSYSIEFTPTVSTEYTDIAHVTLIMEYTSNATFKFMAPTELKDAQATIVDVQTASPGLSVTCTGDCTWPQTISDSTTGDPVSDTGPGIPRDVKGSPTPVGGTIYPYTSLHS